MGIRITTDEKGPVKVYRNDRGKYPSYAVRVSRKEDDAWISGFQPIKFRRGVEVADKTEIVIYDAFPVLESWVKDEKQYTRISWMIMDFDEAGARRPDPQPQPRQESFEDVPDGFSAAEDDIPF